MAIEMSTVSRMVNMVKSSFDKLDQRMNDHDVIVSWVENFKLKNGHIDFIKLLESTNENADDIIKNRAQIDLTDQRVNATNVRIDKTEERLRIDLVRVKQDNALAIKETNRDIRTLIDEVQIDIRSYNNIQDKRIAELQNKNAEL